MNRDNMNDRKILFVKEAIIRLAIFAQTEREDNSQDLNFLGLSQKNNQRISNIVCDILNNKQHEQIEKFGIDAPSPSSFVDNVIPFPRNNVIPFRQG